MLTEYRHGALYVVQNVPSRHELDHALRQIDQRMFFEKQITYENEEVWCVVIDVGGDHPPLTIMEWRDEKGNPIPELTSGLIDRVARMERNGAQLSKRAITQNQWMIERRRKEAYESWAEIAHDMVPRITGKTRPVLHRSQALRMSRDKQRNRGENV